MSQDDGGKQSAIQETLVRKYKCMIKVGVPLDRVQQLAGVKTGASAKQVASIVQQGGPLREGEEEKEESSKNLPVWPSFLGCKRWASP